MKALLPLLVLPLLALAQDKKQPPAKADPPRVLFPIPLTATVGTKTKLILRGQKLETVTEVKTSAGTVKLIGKGKKAAVPNNYPAKKLGDNEVEIELELPKDFAGEFVELRAVSPGGTSDVYKLSVARGDVAEKEANDSFDQAQTITLSATISGTFGREKDVDVFQFTGKAGQSVTVEVIAAKLGAPTDALLTIYDSQRRVLATADDDADGQPDPQLTVKLPRDGTYYVSLLESCDLGGTAFSYRLRIR